MADAALEFYNNPEPVQAMQVLVGRQGQLSSELLPVVRDGILLGEDLPSDLTEALGEGVEQLYSSVRRVEVTESGYDYVFEIGHLPAQNASNPESSKKVLRGASYQGSLTGNFGNGFETVVDNVLNPNDSITYVASMGMGLSSPISSAERKYLSRYGRLLVVDGRGVAQPLPVVTALAKALEKSDIEINTLYSDSAGALINVAYGSTHGAGNIQTAHQNVRTNIWDMSLPKLGYGMLRTDPQLSAGFAQTSPDALRMRTAVTDFTGAHLGDAFAAKGYKPGKSLAMLKAYALGLGRGESQGDPLLKDNQALVRSNPNAKVLLTVGSLDPLANHPGLQERMEFLVRSISAQGGDKVMAMIVDGTAHSIQTHYPQYLRAIGKAAFK